jgi:hypothetical protein
MMSDELTKEDRDYLVSIAEAIDPKRKMKARELSEIIIRLTDKFEVIEHRQTRTTND